MKSERIPAEKNRGIGAIARPIFRLWKWWCFLIVAALFRFVPELDLVPATWFYNFNEPQGFLAARQGWSRLIYAHAHTFGMLMYFVLTAGALVSLLWPRFRPYRASWVFLLMALLVGPALLVNGVLKNGFHRARPIQIEEFNGSLRFSPAFVVANQCETNCSFVSGHVALAAFVLAFGLVGNRRRRQWMGCAIVFVAVMGFARMMVGAHFLSDVIFAFYAVFWSALFCRWVVDQLLPTDPVAVIGH